MRDSRRGHHVFRELQAIGGTWWRRLLCPVPTPRRADGLAASALAEHSCLATSSAAHVTSGRQLMRVNIVAALTAALASLVLLVTPHGHAHELDAGNPPRQVRINNDLSKLRSKRYGALELRIAPYFPAVDREFSSATPYRDAFGKGPSWTFGLEGDWQIFHIPHLGSIGPGLGWHFGWKNGTAPFTDPATPGESAHPQRMWIMPM